MFCNIKVATIVRIHLRQLSVQKSPKKSWYLSISDAASVWALTWPCTFRPPTGLGSRPTALPNTPRGDSGLGLLGPGLGACPASPPIKPQRRPTPNVTRPSEGFETGSNESPRCCNSKHTSAILAYTVDTTYLKVPLGRIRPLCET
jgi:hypothetical protein